MATEDRVSEESNGRHESFEEKLDRNWNDLLQELRVMQTGAQIITAFLMTLSFQNRFDDLEAYQVGLYITLLAFSALLTGLIMMPVAIHRQLFGLHVKDSTVAQGHRIVKAAVLGIGLMATGCVAFIVDVVAGDRPAFIIGGIVLAIMLVMLWLLPRLLKRAVRSQRAED
ncbi:DUF6328 family protein [Arthrobacter sp. I2-34]|uniref:DUF6328 family protein n=1 Tax=Arthrobacter hankyongi TaxID=2904801 RepID=A0ABS9L2F8_9MICC|nr:DUF6328 family protein [Arthrobacter hankyongi]MCG2620829.1 DUF6328 family protein [Arthrobacter hankyongi]